MSVGDETTLKAARSFLERQQLQYTETDEQYCTKLSVKVAGKTGHCSVYNFEKTYGNIGAGFIHVHHLKSLSELGKRYQLNPLLIFAI